MNQREATVTLIDFARERAPEDKRVLAALKVLEKRAEVLRHRHERRHAVLADDLFDEPLTVTFQQFRGLFDEIVCVGCWKWKEPDVAFCARCFARLDGPTAKAFNSARSTILFGFCRALRFFGRRPVQGAGGVLYWPEDEASGACGDLADLLRRRSSPPRPFSPSPTLQPA